MDKLIWINRFLPHISCSGYYRYHFLLLFNSIVDFKDEFCSQLLKSLFGANLIALWYNEPSERSRSSTDASFPAISDQLQAKKDTLYTCCGFEESHVANIWDQSRRFRSVTIGILFIIAALLKHCSHHWPNRTVEKGKKKLKITFRNVNNIGSDKIALSSYIRLFESMVVKAFKVIHCYSSHVNWLIIDHPYTVVHCYKLSQNPETSVGPALRVDSLVRQLLPAGCRPSLHRLCHPAVRISRRRIHPVSHSWLLDQ